MATKKAKAAKEAETQSILITSQIFRIRVETMKTSVIS